MRDSLEVMKKAHEGDKKKWESATKKIEDKKNNVMKVANNVKKKVELAEKADQDAKKVVNNAQRNFLELKSKAKKDKEDVYTRGWDKGFSTIIVQLEYLNNSSF